MRGEDIRTQPWSVMVDLFRYRDPTEEEQAETEETDEARLEPALTGVDADAAENWTGDPSMPLAGLGEMGIPAAGFGPVGGAPGGGWSNLEADPTDTW
ncbi:hypothetical protein AHF37_08664 [Paragonimus kellicotti]|nr:hypothetical protein AHF37_08664 [Paragonimus kellicotti]